MVQLKFILCTLLLLFIGICQGQVLLGGDTCSSLTDSTEDNRILMQLCKALSSLQEYQLDSAEYHVNSAVESSRLSARSDLKREAHYLSAIIYSVSFQLPKMDSLLDEALKYTQEDSVATIIYLRKSYAQNQMGKYDEAKETLDQVRSKIGDDTTGVVMLDYLLELSVYYEAKRDYLKKYNTLLKAKELVQKHPRKQSRVDDSFFNLYQYLGLHEESRDLSLAGVKDAKKAGDDLLEIASLIGLANAYYNLEDLESLRSAVKKAETRIAETGQYFGNGYLDYLLGEAHANYGELDSAQYYFEKGLLSGETHEDLFVMQTNAKGLAEYYLELGDLEKAETYALKATEGQATPDLRLLDILGKIYNKSENFEKANDYFLKGLEVRTVEEENRTKEKLMAKLFRANIQQETALKAKAQQWQLERQQYFLFIALGFILGLIAIVYYVVKRNRWLKKGLERQELIEEQARELQKTDELKTRLFANVSHEIRTPLTLIFGPLGRILKDGSLQQETKETLTEVLNNGDHLLSLTDQLISISKSEFLANSIAITRTSLESFLKYLENKFKPLAEIRDLKFELKNKVGEAVNISSDIDKLETICSNLISNAIKYNTLDGQISVQVEKIQDQLQIKVSDTGRGIHEKDLKHIFTRYYQAKSAPIVAEGGFGIGLSISKEYIEVIGGSIEVKSSPGQGSTFTITFPLSLEPSSESSEISSYTYPVLPSYEKEVMQPLSEESSEKGSLLIVEDNIKMCRYLEEILGEEYALAFCYNGKEALKYLDTNIPDLMIIDLMMPVMDGMTFIEEVKKKPELITTPRIVLTAKNSILDELKALRVGIDDYLLKPFDEFELRARIYNLLELAEDRMESLAENYLLESEISTSIEPIPISQEEKLWLADLEEKIIPLAKDHKTTLETFAENFNISTSLLHKKVKRVTGMPPKKYLNEIRLLMGRKMIENKEVDSIKAAAFSVGFKSTKVFSRKFKLRFGKYPSDYLFEKEYSA